MIEKTNQLQHWMKQENALAYLKSRSSAARNKKLARLDHNIQKIIVSFLPELQGAENPHLVGDGSAMRGEDRRRRYGLGDYRIVCEIDDTSIIVVVVRIRHRSSVYK